MATIEGEAARRRVRFGGATGLWLAIGAISLAACARSEPAPGVPPDVAPPVADQPGEVSPEPPVNGREPPPDAPPRPEAPRAPDDFTPRIEEPNIRVGLAVGRGTVRFGGGAALTIAEPNGAVVARLPSGAERVARAASGAIAIAARGRGDGSARSAEQFILFADSGGYVRLDGHDYRGEVTLLRDRTGITVVNRVPIETYLAAVVPSELGRRVPAELEALRAQAVVSRTYALRNLRRWAVSGFDLYATVADQVYLGVSAETDLASAAVADTRGQVLTYAGGLIDAFFSSTCAGRTAEATEVFRYASRTYLQSVRDESPDGVAYCSISPRYRWHEEWSGDRLTATLRRTLPAVAGIAAERIRGVRAVRVAARTGSGRVALLAIALSDGPAEVKGPSVRQVLRAPTGDPLRSNAFELDATTTAGRVTRLVANGSGAGHAVGFCQWGAIGRARAGHGYDAILTAYFVGTSVERWY